MTARSMWTFEECLMHTALYLRVSTIHQKPDLQADSLRRYAIRAGLEIVAEYLDVAISGRKEGRPQLQALMRAAHHHEFGAGVCLPCDRRWQHQGTLPQSPT